MEARMVAPPTFTETDVQTMLDLADAHRFSYDEQTATTCA